MDVSSRQRSDLLSGAWLFPVSKYNFSLKRSNILMHSSFVITLLYRTKFAGLTNSLYANKKETFIRTFRVQYGKVPNGFARTVKYLT